MSTDNNGVNYKTLNDLPIMDGTNDNTYALVADGDSMKRVPGSMLGGGGVKTAIFKSIDYDNALAGLQTAGSSAPVLECINMTFEEAYETVMNGEPILGVAMAVIDGPTIQALNEVAIITAEVGFQCLVFTELFWTSAGLSFGSPINPK